MPSINLTYRPVSPGSAYNFAISSWLKTWEYYVVERQGMLVREFYREYHPVVSDRLERSRTLLAVFADDPDCYVGYVCGDPGVLHFAWIKKAFRRDGIATELIKQVCGDESGIITSEHMERSMYESFRKKGWRFEGEGSSVHTAETVIPGDARSAPEGCHAVEGGILPGQDPPTGINGAGPEIRGMRLDAPDSGGGDEADHHNKSSGTDGDGGGPDE